MSIAVAGNSSRTRVLFKDPTLVRIRAAFGNLFPALVFFTAILLGASTAQADEPTREQVTYAFFDNMSEMIGHWAHPTLDIYSTRVDIDSSGAHIDIRYRRTDPDEAAVITRVLVPINEFGWFTRLKTERNSNTIVPAFFAMTMAKAIATRIIETQVEDHEGDDRRRNEALRAIQQEMRSKWNSMDGNELCRYILLYQWVDTGAWSRFLST